MPDNTTLTLTMVVRNAQMMLRVGVGDAYVLLSWDEALRMRDGLAFMVPYRHRQLIYLTHEYHGEEDEGEVYTEESRLLTQQEETE